jgi:WD40 repeat protein
LESGVQIGEDWQDDGEKKEEVYNIALSPNNTIVASGGQDRTVRLWEVETGKVITKWTGHTDYVMSVCWSADGKRVLSGSLDETVRVWDVKTGETVMAIKTGHLHVWAVISSPDNAKFATGGFKDGIKIWDAKTGELFIIKLKHDQTVCSLV